MIGQTIADYRVTETFVVVREAPGDKASVHSLRVVENWSAEFKGKQKR